MSERSRPHRGQTTHAVAPALALILLLHSCGGGGSPDASVPPVAASYAIGGSVSGLDGPGLILRRNATETLEMMADGAFTFPTALRSGERYEVIVARQPTGASPRQVCAVANGSGVVGSEAVRNVLVSCRDMTARFLHVAIEGTQSVQSFSIDPGTGALAEIESSPFLVDVPNPRSVATSPDGRFLYVFGGTTLSGVPPTQVAVLQIDADTGDLSAVPDGALTIPGILTSSPVFLRSGRAMYFSVDGRQAPAHVENRVYGFAVDPDSGTLGSLPGSPYAVPDESIPRGTSLSPDEDRLYVAYGATQGSSLLGAGVAVFQVSPADGSLLRRSQTSLSFLPTSLVPGPGGRHLYAGGSGALATLAIDEAGEDLALRAEVPLWESPFTGTNSLRFAPSGRQAYLLSTRPISAGETFINSIGVFDVDGASGSLTEVPSSRVGGGGTWSMPYLFAEPRGRYLIAARGVTASPSPRIEQVWSVWAIDPETGRLSAAAGSPVVSTYDADRLQQVSLDPSGRFLFSTDYNALSVGSFQIDLATGAVSVASTANTGSSPRGFVAVGLQ
jgi:6-phosphogluconolactonase (cycloisomerase 2 family)